MDILSSIAKVATLISDNKEVISIWVLIGVAIKQVLTIKDNTNAMQLQRATCDGKFNVQALEISNIKDDVKETKGNSKEALERADKAEDTAKKAFECVTKIDKKVGTLTGIVEKAREDYNKYLEDKHNTAKSLTKQEE